VLHIAWLIIQGLDSAYLHFIYEFLFSCNIPKNKAVLMCQ
jgi:hypothetical protein